MGADMAKAADIRAKTNDELKDQLLELRKEAFNLRFQATSGQLENTARARQVCERKLWLSLGGGVEKVFLVRNHGGGRVFHEAVICRQSGPEIFVSGIDIGLLAHGLDRHGT